MIRTTKLQYSTIACLLAILCYGLPFFHDNALGGLVKPTFKVMAKSQKNGEGQPPKPKKVTYATSEEKVKIAKQLYKDNPSKVYADAVKRAEANLAKERAAKKK